MGTLEGGIYHFDPLMRARCEVKRFNTDATSIINKNRAVELVKWIEPTST